MIIVIFILSKIPNGPFRLRSCVLQKSAQRALPAYCYYKVTMIRFSLPDAILSFIVTVRLPKLSILTYISSLPLIGIRWWLIITNWWANFWLLFNQLVITRNICLLFETLFIVLLWYSMDEGWTTLICYQRSLTHCWSWVTA